MNPNPKIGEILWRDAKLFDPPEEDFYMCNKIINFFCCILPLFGALSGILALVVDSMPNDKFSFSKVYVDQYFSLSNATKNITSFESVQVCQKPKDSRDYTCSNSYIQTTNYRSFNHTNTIECYFSDTIKDVNQPINYPNTFEVLYFSKNHACHLEQDRYYPIKRELIIMLVCFMAISLFIVICCFTNLFCFILSDCKNNMCCCCETTSSSVNNNTHDNFRKSAVRKSAVRKSDVRKSTASKSTDSTVSKSTDSIDSKRTASIESTASIETTDIKYLIFKV